MYLLDITPQTSPRPRFLKSGIVYMPSSYMKYKRDVMFLMKLLKIPKADYSEIELIACFPYPKSTPLKNRIEGVKMRVKPDYDNTAKFLSDCLEELGILENDSQISDGIIRKRYTTRTTGYIKFTLK